MVKEMNDILFSPEEDTEVIVTQVQIRDILVANGGKVIDDNEIGIIVEMPVKYWEPSLWQKFKKKIFNVYHSPAGFYQDIVILQPTLPNEILIISRPKLEGETK